MIIYSSFDFEEIPLFFKSKLKGANRKALCESVLVMLLYTARKWFVRA